MSWTIVIPQIELKAQVRSPVQRHVATMRYPQDEIPHRGAMFWDFWMKWSTFCISRSPLDVGFQRSCETTGRSNSLYYSESVKNLCSGNSNKLKLSSDMKENPSDLLGYLLAKPPFEQQGLLLGPGGDCFSLRTDTPNENLKMIKDILKSKKISKSYVHFLP